MRTEVRRLRFVGAASSVLAACVCAPLPAQTEAPRRHAFAPFDLDGDGTPEIRQLDVLADVGPATAGAVVVLVEGRLLRPREGVADDAIAALRARLMRHADDVAAQVGRARLASVDVHAGPPHEDGRAVLALRRYLQACRDEGPLAGVVLVGHFPDALLVRTCNWRRNELLQLPGKDGTSMTIDPKTTNVRCVPEFVAHRCDLVLADLDGDWERVYVPGPTNLPSVTAVFGDVVPDAGGPVVAMQTGGLRVVDVFHVRDGAAVADREAFAVRLDAADRDHECSAEDRRLGNPLAQPEIAVSRIDARQQVAWAPDPALEQRLLVEYFDRNHAFRTTPLPSAQRKPASICHGLGSGLASLRAADPAWREFAEVGYDESARCDLVALVKWLQRPAVLRTLRAHSDPWAAAFETTDVAALERASGGSPWAWRRVGSELVPSLRGNGGGRADFFLYRTLWQNQVLPAQPYLLVHTGCEAVSPPGACELAFDEPRYGQYSQTDALLFFTPCLALVGRAKVFYDEPRGFCEALAAGATFGDAWRRYFAIEGAAADWGEAGGDIGRKRAYFWSVLGDWTLRLPR